MEFNQVIELIKVVSGSELTTFQYEEGNQKILMQAGNVVVAPAVAESELIVEKAAKEASAGAGSAEAALADGAIQALNVEKSGGKLVKSPLVGRFYAAPSEDAKPFVQVGDKVKKGQTLAIVEAMKLMNEIESEFDGTVMEILVENGQGVEYGQPLFRLE